MNSLRCVVWCLPLGLLSAIVGCSPPAPPALPPPEPPTVIVANPLGVRLKPYREFLGRTVAVQDVDIVPEVTGIIKAVNFPEGGTVKAGDVLFEIDPLPFEAARDKAKADQASAEAQKTNAERDLDRLKNLQGASGAKEKDEAVARRDVAEAQIKAAKAAVVQAEFNLSKTKVVAPINGGINKTERTSGNLVTAYQTKLTRIVSVHPIYAYFDVDETTSLMYRDMVYKDKTIGNPRDLGMHLKCNLRLKNEEKWQRPGEVDYIARDVNRVTASREIRGVFDNKDGYITPGDSCRVRVEAGPERDVIVVPEIAIGSQQSTRFVYVLDAENKVLPRTVTLGEAREGLQVVVKGLTADDRVIVNGLLRVRPGVTVKPVTEPIKLPDGFK